MSAAMIPSLSIIGVGLIALTGHNPVRGLAAGLVRVMAAGYLARKMAAGAWAQRHEWQMCLDKARREL
jgi:hypothetical protein